MMERWLEQVMNTVTTSQPQLQLPLSSQSHVVTIQPTLSVSLREEKLPTEKGQIHWLTHMLSQQQAVLLQCE
jgi:hypothetical protein